MPVIPPTMILSSVILGSWHLHLKILPEGKYTQSPKTLTKRMRDAGRSPSSLPVSALCSSLNSFDFALNTLPLVFSLSQRNTRGGGSQAKEPNQTKTRMLGLKRTTQILIPIPEVTKVFLRIEQ